MLLSLQKLSYHGLLTGPTRYVHHLHIGMLTQELIRSIITGLPQETPKPQNSKISFGLREIQIPHLSRDFYEYLQIRPQDVILKGGYLPLLDIQGSRHTTLQGEVLIKLFPGVFDCDINILFVKIPIYQYRCTAKINTQAHTHRYISISYYLITGSEIDI